jgi:hypothetical protein
MHPLRMGLIGTRVVAQLLHWSALKLMADRHQLVARAILCRTWAAPKKWLAWCCS